MLTCHSEQGFLRHVTRRTGAYEQGPFPLTPHLRRLELTFIPYQIIEKKQMQDFMKLYSGLVERCFMSCAQDFTSKALTAKEVSPGERRPVETRKKHG